MSTLHNIVDLTSPITDIDYRGNIKLGMRVTGRTWISDPPIGAQFERNVEFANAAGKVIVRAKTRWAMLDKATGRLLRVPAEVAAAFLGSSPDPGLRRDPRFVALRMTRRVKNRWRCLYSPNRRTAQDRVSHGPVPLSARLFWARVQGCSLSDKRAHLSARGAVWRA